MFHDELFAGKGPVTVWLNSPGGDCIAASQIYTMLMDYQDDVTVTVALADTRPLESVTDAVKVIDPDVLRKPVVNEDAVLE